MQPHRSSLPLCLFLLAALASSGCLQLQQSVELNPDLSGRVQFQLSMANPMGGMLQAMAGDFLKDAPPEARAELDKLTESDMARSLALKILHDAKGVDTWEKVEFHTTPDHQITFSGIAYFPDFNQFSMTAAAEEAGPGNFTSLLRAEPTGSGLIRIGRAPAPMTDAKKGVLVPPAELEERVASLKEQWAVMGPMMTMMVQEARSIHQLRVGGEITEVQAWDRKAPDQAELKLEMSAAVTGLSALVQDDAFLRQTLAQNGANPQGFPVLDEAAINRIIFADEAAPEVLFTPGKPLFDYASEVARAKKEQSPELQSLLQEAAQASGDKLGPFPF